MRPRRFGKSLWLQTLASYYDLRRKDEFDELFGGLAVGGDPTSLAHRYFVLQWNFSNVDASGGVREIAESLRRHVCSRAEVFAKQYQAILPDPIWVEGTPQEVLTSLLSVVSESPDLLRQVVADRELPAEAVGEAFDTMCTWYNGYRFNEDVDELVYNPTKPRRGTRPDAIGRRSRSGRKGSSCAATPSSRWGWSGCWARKFSSRRDLRYSSLRSRDARRQIRRSALREEDPAMHDARNVLGGRLEICCMEPMTGFYRTGRCEVGPDDHGVHAVCAEMTEGFLAFSRLRGNDLSSPSAFGDFPGLKPGDRWCLCAARWKEAYDAGAAPPIVLASTHEATLGLVTLEELTEHAADLC